MVKLEKKNLWLGMAFVLVAGILIGSFINSSTMSTMPTAEKTFAEKSMDEKRTEFISEKQAIIDGMKERGMYRCCLEKPCTYCIEKTPGHGEGAECSCVDDVMNGVHPCGECIGEILEGHGDPNLAKYFARAIAEKTGQIDAIKEIISEKYGISVEEQL